MKKMFFVRLFAGAALTSVACFQNQAAGAETGAPSITIQADKPGARINPEMWGLFFEDINFGADGGLYAELVKNRSFEFPEPLMGWTASGDTLNQVKLKFATKEEAVAFAERSGFDFSVELPKPHRVRPRSYADNFRYIPPKSAVAS